MEHTMGKSFRHNPFGTISSASSSDTGRQLDFVQDGKNTNSNIGSPKDLAESKKKQKPLFNPYTGKKLEETEEELDSSNEKLAPDDLVSMLNMHKRSSSTRKRKGPTEVGGEMLHLVLLTMSLHFQKIKKYCQTLTKENKCEY